MPNDSFNGAKPGVNGIPTGGIAIGGGNNDALLSPMCRILIPATDGNIAVVMADDTEITLPACKAGVPYWGLFKKVKADGTSATGIVGMY